MQIIIQPENRTKNISNVSTVMGLLNKLGLKASQALVIRENQLLTPDRRIYQDDHIIVRLVASRG